MKNVIVLIILLLVTLSCKAQQIVPVEKAIEYRDADSGVPDGVYLKDINGLLNKYLGTWKGTVDNKNYTFVIIKYKNNLSRGVSQDELMIRYLITTSNGTVIEDTRSLSDDSSYVIKGDYFNKTASYYVSSYMGKNADCGQSGNLFITGTKLPNQIKLFLIPDKVMINIQNCPGQKAADKLLPVDNEVLLTKQ
ncbi:DUF6705 family protein [Flavobacterium soyae]|uniref:DUF6705 family protein n=1 Tax=Flavobacterium soyae TaxID=2903098 RepID=UPI001E61389B|nr:DUF6705 family protein [Flavobacterium soyae]MCD9575636.1 hypothetical protein [Flavobacterium soyae]